jgi:hypothetical protein
MHRALLVPLLLLGAVDFCAQSPLDRPHIGYLVDSGGVLRLLYGTAANFILGEVLSSGNTSCASSSASALVKTPEEVILLGANGETKNRWSGPGGDALFAFHVDGSPAFVFFLEGSRLMRVVEDRLEAVPLDMDRLGGTVVAIAAPDGASALVAVARGKEVWLVAISAESGEVTDERLLAGVTGSVHLAGDGSVLHTENGDLVWRASDGAEKRFTLGAEVRSFAPLGAGWVAISVQHTGAEGLTRYGLRLDAGREGLYQLPEVAQ